MKTPGGDIGMLRSLHALSSRYGLDEAQELEILGLLRALSSADRPRRAPTTVRAPELALDVHVADSLVALEVDAVRAARTVVDIGTGAGFPGLPLAVALRESEVRLLESQVRKCAFIEGARLAAGVRNASVVRTRAEEWTEGLAANDLATARAVAPLPVVLEYAAPLLRVGGSLVDWRGKRDDADERMAAAAARELGMELREIRRVKPYPGARDHHLHVYEKAVPTPSRFPRRAGVARKRPLGC